MACATPLIRSSALTEENAVTTMFEKIWSRHLVAEGPGGQSLLYIDRHLLHEGATHAFARLERAGRSVRRPEALVATADHYVPTGPGSEALANEEIRGMVEGLASSTRELGVTLFGPGDARQGIVHVIGPEQGLTQPGILLVCGDSHTATHGAFGAIAFGIGSTEVEHVLATGCLWQKKPKAMRITVTGPRPAGITAKDVILAIIAKIGAGGGVGHAIEYAGPVIAGMTMEERMTVCNMSIEAGARAGMIAPDETTFRYVEGRPYAPKGEHWTKALVYWKTLPSDADAAFDTEVTLDAGSIAPTVTWGTSPQEALPITGNVPDPAREANPTRREALGRAIDYMGLRPGMSLTEIKVDRVFIGSCTNSRIEDLREVFTAAGFEWRDPGCSMCVGMNGDTAREGERVASTSNRNFEGRQGKGARTHLMSPAMAAAAAVTGRLTDVRTLSPSPP